MQRGPHGPPPKPGAGSPSASPVVPRRPENAVGNGQSHAAANPRVVETEPREIAQTSEGQHPQTQQEHRLVLESLGCLDPEIEFGVAPAFEQIRQTTGLAAEQPTRHRRADSRKRNTEPSQLPTKRQTDAAEPPRHNTDALGGLIGTEQFSHRFGDPPSFCLHIRSFAELDGWTRVAMGIRHPRQCSEPYLDAFEKGIPRVIIGGPEGIGNSIQQNGPSQNLEDLLEEVRRDTGEIGETVDQQSSRRKDRFAEVCNRFGRQPKSRRSGMRPGDRLGPYERSRRHPHQGRCPFEIRGRNLAGEIGDLLQHRIIVIGAETRVDKVANCAEDSVVAVAEVVQFRRQRPFISSELSNENVESRRLDHIWNAGAFGDLAGGATQSLDDHPRHSSPLLDHSSEQVESQGSRGNNDPSREAEIDGLGGSEGVDLGEQAPLGGERAPADDDSGWASGGHSPRIARSRSRCGHPPG